MGDALVDLLPLRPEARIEAVSSWRRCTGGAPANVAVGLSRLGKRVAFVGVVGQDRFGNYLKAALHQEGVEVTRLRQTDQGKTGLCFIAIGRRGERSFTHFRTNSAEHFLGPRDVHPDLIREAGILHFGTNSLIDPPARQAVRRMLRMSRGARRIASCDPNLRLDCWAHPPALRKLLRELLPQCQIVKLSEEEMTFVTGARTASRALERLASWGVTLPIITLGSRGATFLYKGTIGDVPGRRVRVVDTTGAGDGFMVGLLSSLAPRARTRNELERLSVGAIEGAVRRGCEIGAQVVCRLGAVDGLPWA